MPGENTIIMRRNSERKYLPQIENALEMTSPTTKRLGRVIVGPPFGEGLGAGGGSRSTMRRKYSVIPRRGRFR